MSSVSTGSQHADGIEAVIVAGGLGTRMLPLTQRRPKHLLPVAGQPFVAHQLAKLSAAGVRRVILATSYQAAMFEPTLGDGSAWGVELVYAREKTPLGTAGAIRSVSHLLTSNPDQPVVVLNGDILSAHDLGAQLEHHQRNDADVTLHLVTVPDARAYGCVPTDDDGRVTAFLEKSPDPVTRQINAGCYVFARRVIDDIPTERAVSVERETFPRLIDEGKRVLGLLEDSYWLDVGTPSALSQASADVVRGIAASPAVIRSAAEAWISSEAALIGRAVARGGSAIGPGAMLDDSVIIEASIVDEGASIGARTRVIESVVGAGAMIGTDVVLRHAVVGDGAEIGSDCELLHGTRIAADAVVTDGAIRFS
jgi:mannose-1-phosphate guanylyltransferase